MSRTELSNSPDDGLFEFLNLDISPIDTYKFYRDIKTLIDFDKNRRVGRPSSRFPTLLNVIQDRENEFILLDDFEKKFKELGVKNPRDYASTSICHFNKVLRVQNIHYEVQTISVTSGAKSVNVCRLRNTK
jgi:hypothetical protein